MSHIAWEEIYNQATLWERPIRD